MNQPVIPKPSQGFVKQLNYISSLPQTRTKRSKKGLPLWLGSSAVSLSLVILGFILMPSVAPMIELNTIPETAAVSFLDEWQSINEAYIVAFIEEPEWY